MKEQCVRLFNSLDSRLNVMNRIARMNTEAKEKGLPPSKWPFPPDYVGYEPYLNVVKSVMGEDLPKKLQLDQQPSLEVLWKEQFQPKD